MEEQDYIQFEAYVSGEMSKNELLDFENRLQIDSKFNEAFQIYKDLSSHLKHEVTNEQEISDFKANLDVVSSMYFNKHEVDPPIEDVTEKSNFYKYAAAASVIVLLGFFVFNPFSDPTYEDYNDFDSISLMTRSAGDKITIEAEESFNAKNYKDALTAFNIILEDDFANLEIQLYKSIALIETNQFKEGDVLLLKIINGSSAYRDNAKWILALSYLKQEKNAASIEVLKTIPEDAEYYKSAQKLLKKLD
ncbi:tetratricopeptide repeat protein [Winogradskyella undariae]|uniref:tetratricopeptide repeat protein n=1 Tax=Winogradskyella undariae TaxID=1285465 RepID=UPI0015C7018B|nr:hypothetical protein [Winogradskyella undariae]QNK77227.1 hypothetical protein H7F37_14100 [Winogradskyella sp. PAMC22761]